jgi:phenylacetic acid degradation protein paaN
MTDSVATEHAAAAELFARHRETVEQALVAISERGYWSPYPEHPKAYADSAAADGKAAFSALLGSPFPLEQPGADSLVGGERSPYGLELGITYRRSEPEALLTAMRGALPAWRDTGPKARAGVCLEILARLNARSHELANAVMHTTGQAYMMAFQAGGPHAQDRGLEAVAYAYAEMTRHADTADWEKPQGKRPPLRLRKRFRVVPRGVALVIGCNTFPTWNAYPGLFASLATGNPVLVKPSRRAILPLALTVAVARETLADAGVDPNVVCLAVDAGDERLAASLAVRPEVAIVDYTGSTEFGLWLEQNARQARVYAEKAGVNPVVIDSTDDYRGMLANLAFTLSLYSGQMCTTTQNLFVPRAGIETDEGHKGADKVAADLGAAFEGLLADEATAVAILGAIANAGVLERLEAASRLGRVVLASRSVEHPEFPEAVVRTPTLIAVDAVAEDVYGHEHFGPIGFLIETDSTEHSLERVRATVASGGALNFGVYSTDEAVLAAAEETALEARVALSCNLTEGVYVNQSAAFSDFHGTGGNPAANATFTDGDFVSGRFAVVQSRRHLDDVD